MNKIAWYLIAGMALTIIILSLVLIYRKPVSTIEPFNDKPFKDSINYLLKDNTKIHAYNDSITHAFDSVTSLENSTTKRYYEKIVYLRGATTDELDQYILSVTN